MAAAAAARRRPVPPPVYMFNRYADTIQLTGQPEPGQGWIEMECDSKEAYGCGENIKEAAKVLALYARLGDGDPLITSTLAIRMTDDALGRFDEELERGIGPPLEKLFQPKTTAWAHILMHAPAEELMIITLGLERQNYRSLVYNLFYDHKRASLTIIKPVQVPAVVLKPVPARRTCDGDYELFYMAVNRVPSSLNIEPAVPFLCVFSAARAGANAAAAASVWEMRRNMRWSVPVSVEERFRTDLTFSFQGKGFWVDLSQGLEYCDLAAGDSVVDFSYIELPRECVLDLEKVLGLEQPMEATRTMGCDGDSIWFVCIDQSISDDDDDCAADNLVSMWTLKLLDGGKQAGQWKKEAEFSFSIRELWGFDGFKEAGLPEAPVGYPLLNAADGVLYLALYGDNLGPSAEICWVDHMCSFDLRNKRLLWHGTVHNLHVNQPAAIPSCFFQTELPVTQPAAVPSCFQTELPVTQPAAVPSCFQMELPCFQMELPVSQSDAVPSCFFQTELPVSQSDAVPSCFFQTELPVTQATAVPSCFFQTEL